MARKKKRLGFTECAFLLPVALASDFVSVFVPGFGSIVVLFFRFLFGVFGIQTKGVNALFIGGIFVEALPGISGIPGVTGYLLYVYFAGRAETEVAGVTGVGEKLETRSEAKKNRREGKDLSRRASPSQRREENLAKARQRRKSEAPAFSQGGEREARADRAKQKQRPTVQSGVISGAKPSTSRYGAGPAKREAPFLGGATKNSDEDRERLDRAERSKKKQEMMRV